jgi:uncharacterized DUF497 family protein
VAITFDPKKRAATLAERGLDFEDAERVRHIFSMRKANDREKARIAPLLGL